MAAAGGGALLSRSHLLRDAGDEAAVREHDALGHPGGAGGVRQRDDVVGVHLLVVSQRLGGVHQGPELEAPVEGAAVDGGHGHAALGGEPAHLLHGAGLGDDHLGPRRGRLAVDLVRGVERVGRGGGGAQPRGAEEDEGELGAVAEQVHHHVALPHPEPAQRRRGGPREALHVGVGVDGARLPVDEARAGGYLRETLEAVGLQREVARDLDVR